MHQNMIEIITICKQSCQLSQLWILGSLKLYSFKSLFHCETSPPCGHCRALVESGVLLSIDYQEEARLKAEAAKSQEEANSEEVKSKENDEP